MQQKRKPRSCGAFLFPRLHRSCASQHQFSCTATCKHPVSSPMVQSIALL
ncbi:hypothetical protein EN794_016580 [Mesorhizobium sp. M00.F.Ca.ET.151.01.1.1]|nr:hypothetical protein EN842_16100 [bacterium M00.F.Ca.ET.199.01.1.1]TGS97120.1 hypothetical protein EN820_40625 [bacterium M00.F.Ca.ET.177.01.1.1]TGT62992.1 hypothetical protein EN813_014790 [Mesorhizobium sp. M00.F.Ca.ET.170.01.1.1]TGU14564.1 hypothetical protein EN806_08310 [bacterium M00.F.Ca.ET.163.01.1.1]TGU96467.1 hypothetical protein EN794_016580 [Mesorhizobium sp. M00.F.Ca.ET.151.01.1.1]TGV59024.1 hypothetical protein EN784_16840 [bacterium M00.F.Ca.ET.141.01.1.1]